MDGSPKGRWLPPQIRQDHIDQLIEDGKLRADCGYRLPQEDDVPPKPEAGELVVFKALFDRGFSFPPSKFMLEVQIGRAHV